MSEQFVWHVAVGRYLAPRITKHRLVKRTEHKVRLFGEKWDWDTREREWLAEKEDVFDTFAEAKAAALAVCDQRVENAKAELHRFKTERGQIESMKEPT